MERIKNIIIENGASEVGILRFQDCEIINSRVLSKLDFEPKTVFIGLVPYYTHFCDQDRNISAYALAHDYHLHLKQICEKSISSIQSIYPYAKFAGYVDHSPINEKIAAAKAGLGIIGKHSLLITPKYSSFVFIFELLSDLVFDVKLHNVEGCEGCNKCISACPVGAFSPTQCLSAITQKKGELSTKEKSLIANSGYAWGCDICQLVCPHTVKAINAHTIYTDSQWFNSNVITTPTINTIEDTNDFQLRAYSWRGSQTLLRNIAILNDTYEVLK